MPIKQCLLLILISCLATSAWSADAKKQLQGIKKEISEKKRLITKTTQVENVVTSELAKIDQSLRMREQSLAELNRNMKSVENGLEKTRSEIDSVVKDVEGRKRLIQNRLVAVYKAGEVGNIRFLFSSESLPQMLENLRYMKALLGNDRQMVAEYNERIGKLKDLKAGMEQHVRRKESLKQSIEVKKQEIEAEKENKASYLQKIREDKKSYIASLKGLEANSRRLQSIVEKLEAASRQRQRLEAANRKRYTEKNRRQTVTPDKKGGTSFVPPSTSTGFGSQKGRLSSPAQGRIVGSFGRHKHPEFNSYTVSNGISIAAPIGTEVRSIYPGTIIFSDYFKGYGNMVIVDHGDGFFSLYAHNSKVYKRRGSNVAKNELLASVGDVDSPRGSMLYFEIRYQGRPINPAPWIR
ncbi:MAG: peptidase M23 [Deltaproteobacteria bacterium]|nr:peptidase M23 [Deltaproteobacteria bacterium]